MVEIWHTDYLGILFLCSIAIFVGSYIANRTGRNELRRVAALDAAMEAVSVCGERGGSLMYNPGALNPLMLGTRPLVSWLPSMMNLLKYLAEKAGEARVKILTISYSPFTKMQSADFAMQGYLKAGAPDLYREEDHIYFPDYITGTVGSIGVTHTEKPSAVIIIGGHWWYSNVALIEAASVEGAYTVAGDVYPDDNSGACIAADYVVFSEEVVAMGAYLSNDPFDRSILVGEDVFKLILIGAMVAVFIQTILGL